MLETNPEHELAIADRNLLVTEMLDRSGQAIEALDTAAARTWIDSAAPLAADAARLEQAENRLTEHLIASRSQQIIPATELTRIHYQPPEYPATARKRGIEGWVEIGFVVTPAGEPSELSVIDASQDRYFAEAALAAVREWRFEPVIFMGRAVAQRTFTRVAFILD
jgi:protein TonB